MRRDLACFPFVFLVIGLLSACDGKETTLQPEWGDDRPSCTVHEDCREGELCMAGLCLTACSADHPCPEGDVCDGFLGACIPSSGDSDSFTPGDGDTAGDGDLDGDLTETDRTDEEEETPCASLILLPESILFPCRNSDLLEASFLLKNPRKSGTDLAIEALWHENDDGPNAAFSENLALPFVIGPGAERLIRMEMETDDICAPLGRILLVSNACNGPVHALPLESACACETALPLRVEPPDWDFGLQPYGTAPARRNFSILPSEWETDVVKIASVYLLDGSPHFRIEGPEVEAWPFSLFPGDSLPFEVIYQPITPMGNEAHGGTVRVTWEAGDNHSDFLDVPLRGGNQNVVNGLAVMPTPVDFGETEIQPSDPHVPESYCTADSECPDGQACLIDHLCYRRKYIVLGNTGTETLRIPYMNLAVREDLGDTSCDGMVFIRLNDNPQNEWSSGYAIELRPGLENLETLELGYHPGSTEEQQCSLEVWSDSADVSNAYFPILGQGVAANQKPVARIAMQSHGPAISTEIRGIQVDQVLCFYGNISYDPDGEIVNFSWDLQKPAQSAAGLEFINGQSVNACVRFDRGGDYRIRLRVQDNQRDWSEMAEARVAVEGNEGVQIVLEFSSGEAEEVDPQNRVDVDLMLIDPQGVACSDEHMNSNNICSFSGSNGYAVFTEWSHGAGADGTVEELRNPQPDDGMWTLRVQYQNDCMLEASGYNFEDCLRRLPDNAFQVRIYNPNGPDAGELLFAPLTGVLHGTGDRVSWLLIRNNGHFEPPHRLTE